ncbi:hypothetical protein ACP70R_002067 [Stipagrostis hirtigluma subsp. patula]
MGLTCEKKINAAVASCGHGNHGKKIGAVASCEHGKKIGEEKIRAVASYGHGEHSKKIAGGLFVA